MVVKSKEPSSFRGWITSPLTVLTVFLGLLFFTGGNSFGYARQLVVLRPAAIFVAAVGIYGLRWNDVGRYWPVWSIFGGALALTVAHLVPLPYAWWTSLPGRGLIAEIDAAVGLGKIARPLSMQPEATMNALLSLSVPLAVLSLAVRLDEPAQRRLALVLLALIAVSGFIGLLQLSGIPIAFYYNGADIRPSGLFYNRNHQGALLALAFPLATLAWLGGYGWKISPRIERFGALALVLFILPLAVVTGSRSGLFLVVLGFVLSLLSVSPAVGHPNARLVSWAKYAFGAAVLGGMIWLTVFASRDVALQRLANAGEDLRYPVWESIVQALPAYWPWGTGVGSYVDAYQILEPDALLRPTFSNNAHNDWLEVVFTAGLPGLVLLVSAVFATLTAAVKVLRAGGEQNILPRVGLIIIFILAFASVSDYPVRTPILSAMLAVAAIWAARVRRPAKGRG